MGELVRGKQISKDSGTRIEISKDEKPDSDEKRTVYLQGPSDCLERAKRMIEDTLARSRERQGEERDRDRYRARSRSNDRNLPGTRVLHVAQELVGMLIEIGRASCRERV